MELIVFDKNMNRVGIIDGFTSLVWTRRNKAPGDFSMLLPYNDDKNGLLEPGNIVAQKGGNEAMQISFKRMSKNETGLDEIEIKGYALTEWMGRRILLSEIITEDLEPVQIMRKMVEDTMTQPEDEARQFENVVLGGAETLGDDVISYKGEQFRPVLDAERILMEDHDIGVKVETNQRTGLHSIIFFRGEDKTAESEFPCIFSPEYENIAQQNYTFSNENMRNMAYVKGEKQELTIGEEITGADRREMHISTTDINNDYTDESGKEIKLTDEQVLEKMRERAEEEMAERIEEETFDGVITRAGQLRYKEDFDLGDKVTCIYKRWGLRVDARIEEITETYQGEKRDIMVLFGEGTPTLEKRIKQIARG